MIERDNFWWIKFDATGHICNGKSQFKKLEPSENESYIYMRNPAQEEVKGKGTIVLKFMSIKIFDTG